MTNEDLGKLYDEYNQKFFNNKLKKIKVEFNGRIKRCWGYYSITDDRIAISKHLLSDKFVSQALYDVLAHEMTHAYQAQVLKEKPGHGASFRKLGRYIHAIDSSFLITRQFDPTIYLVNKPDSDNKQYLYFRISINKKTSHITQVNKTQIKKFSVTRRYYRVPIAKECEMPKAPASFHQWKKFLQKECIPVQRVGNVISKVDYATHNMYLLRDAIRMAK